MSADSDPPRPPKPTRASKLRARLLLVGLGLLVLAYAAALLIRL